ncbi:MAG TPA: preprotein translocase subunit SecE [Rubrobacteraceae bacterium]|nr:preprotein translocase subunit SecE [Rubrobacteraceae bacterium]
MGKKRASAAQAKGTNKKSQQQPKKSFFSGIRDFVRGVRAELKRVSWPNRDQLRQSTAVVLIIVLVLGAYVAAWDFVFQSIARLVFLR